MALSLGKTCLSRWISSMAVSGKARVTPLSERSLGMRASMPPCWYIDTQLESVLELYRAVEPSGRVRGFSVMRS